MTEQLELGGVAVEAQQVDGQTSIEEQIADAAYVAEVNAMHDAGLFDR